MVGLDLRKGEHVLAAVRVSIWYELPRCVFAGFWILIPFFLLFPLLLLGTFGIAFFLLLLGSGVVYVAKVWTKLHYSVLLVTDERVIDVEQTGFFTREIHVLEYSDVKKVRSRALKGWRKLFKLGGVKVYGKKRAGYDLEILGVRSHAFVEELINEVK